MFSTYKRVFWLSVVMSIFVFIPFVVNGYSTDVWMRLARIREWVESGFPFTEQLMRGQNYPFGCEMHWTRPLDFIGYAFAWPFIPNWGLKESLEIMTYYVPLLVLLIGIAGFYYGLKGYVTPKTAFFAFWLFFYNIGYSWGQASIGYFDHHIFHSTVLIWCIALTARYFRQPHKLSLMIMAGILTGFGTWLTPEFFINSYILITPFLIYWLFKNTSLKPVLLYTLAYTLTLLSAVSFDHPIAGFWTLDFYRTSLMHAILGAANLALFGLLAIPLFRKNMPRRFIYGILFTSVAGLFLLFTFHSVLLVPMVDPFQYHMWTKKVIEMEPLYNNWSKFLTFGILPFTLTIGLCIWFFRHFTDRISPLVLIATLGSLIYIPICTLHVRAGISFQAFFVFLSACYLHLSFHTPLRSYQKEICFIIFYLIFIGVGLKGDAVLNRFKVWGAQHYLAQYRNDPNIIIPGFLKESLDILINDEKNDIDNKKPEPQNDDEKDYPHGSCRASKTVFDVLRKDTGTGAILTTIWEAPEVLWETGRPVLGGPYDRNMTGLTDLFFIEFDKPPFTRAKDLLKKHQVELLMITHPKCQNTFFTDKDGKNHPGIEDSFWHTVYYQKEKMPKWLKLEYHNYKTNIKIFRFDPTK